MNDLVLCLGPRIALFERSLQFRLPIVVILTQLSSFSYPCDGSELS